jgi:2-oxoglutarate dehydrogenase E2 component (dihydrolipoamide succinyltransferase)
MSVEIKVPSVGESITEGTIARWLKSNGAIVKANEPVCELETDKATTEVMAPSSGRLAITAPEGQKVAIGSRPPRVSNRPNSPAAAAAAVSPRKMSSLISSSAASGAASAPRVRKPRLPKRLGALTRPRSPSLLSRASRRKRDARDASA